MERNWRKLKLNSGLLVGVKSGWANHETRLAQGWGWGRKVFQPMHLPAIDGFDVRKPIQNLDALNGTIRNAAMGRAWAWCGRAA